MSVDVTIVIVSYNSADVIDALLDSIPRAMGDLASDVIVVDNGSSDGTATIVGRRPGVRLLESTNVGFAGGINRGASNAISPDSPLLILNPDVVLDPGSVGRMLERLIEPWVGIVFPRVREPDGRLFQSLRRDPSIPRSLGLGFTGFPAVSETVSSSEDYENAHFVDWALGAVSLVDRRCFDALNGWDESYFLYSEETDFCLRARDHGWRLVYEPSASAIHIGGASGRSERTHSMQILNRVRLYGRRNSLPKSVAYMTLTLLSEFSWYLRGHKESLAAMKALVFPKSRPAELGLHMVLIPR